MTMKNYILLLLALLSISTSAQCYDVIRAGNHFNFGIQDDGTLWSWGRNWNGQLGIGTTTDSSIPVQVNNSTDWKEIDAALLHVLALKTSGTLWTWGSNSYGQLGNNTTEDSTVPIQIGTNNDWQMIGAGIVSSVALKTDGTLWAWGGNALNQLGDGTTIDSHVPIQIGNSDDWSIISAGHHYTLALKNNGTLWAWGYNSNGQLGDNTTIDKSVPTLISNENTWVDIKTGFTHSIALKNDGTLWSWGNNLNGQLGRPVILGNNNHPNQVGNDSDWQTISAGGNFTLAIKTDGSLWAWGQNFYGALGDGTIVDSAAPIQIGEDTDWTAIHCGGYHSIAQKSDGGIYLWGWNAQGQLGNGTTEDSLVPININSCMLSLDEQYMLPVITIFPNPTDGYINISSANESDVLLMKIYDTNGKLLLEQNEHFKSIDLRDFQKGIYFLNIITNQGTITHKILKK